MDLKDYVRPTEAETFASLRDQGLIDLKAPDRSHILKLIRMSRPKTPLLTKQARDVEYAAFRDWIASASRNHRLIALPAATKRARPQAPDAVIRHTRIDSVVASFERNIWSQEARCMGCHRPNNTENIKKHGPRVAWFVPDSPEATMQRLIAQGDVNVEKPEASLLLLKPLNKVAHGGGVKMLYGDAGYKMFRAWVEDYARSVRGTYKAVTELPPPPSEVLVDLRSIMAVTNGPATWKDRLLRVDAYAWDSAQKAWSPRPVATGERQMFAEQEQQPTGTNLIMFAVLLAKQAPKGSEAARLPSGRYLLKFYCDVAGKLNNNYTLPTNSSEFYQGQQEIEASWGGGWESPVKVTVKL